MESVTHGASIRRRLLTDRQIISHRLLCIQSNKTTRREVRVSQNLWFTMKSSHKFMQLNTKFPKNNPKSASIRCVHRIMRQCNVQLFTYGVTATTDWPMFICLCYLMHIWRVIHRYKYTYTWLYSSIHGHKMNGRLNPVQIMYMYDGSVTNESHDDPIVNALELLPMYCRSTTDKQSHLPMKLHVHALSKL